MHATDFMTYEIWFVTYYIVPLIHWVALYLRNINESRVNFDYKVVFAEFLLASSLTIRNSGEELNRESHSVPFPLQPKRFFIFEGHANMPFSYCHATYIYISWQRLERQNNHSQLILVYNPANANDKLCIRPFCTVFNHCWKLTSVLRYHALFFKLSTNDVDFIMFNGVTDSHEWWMLP